MNLIILDDLNKIIVDDNSGKIIMIPEIKYEGWVLSTGIWDDNAYWDDNAIWKDNDD